MNYPEVGGVLESCRLALQSQGNRMGFALRNFLNWQPRPFHEIAEPDRDLPCKKPESILKGQTLMARYQLTPLRQRASVQRFVENLAYLEWLDAFHHAAPAAFTDLKNLDCLNWLDVGAKNWAYVDALDVFIRRHFQTAYRLDGVELDAHRRYLDFTTRKQAAAAYTQLLPHAQYHEMNALDWRRKAQVISHFLPFVLPDPHLAWGLPLRYFQPQILLTHLLSLLEPGGILLVVNQGEWEAEAQQALWKRVACELPIQVQTLGKLPASFIEYRYPRYGWVCVKGAL